jgi:hypothetical protein
LDASATQGQLISGSLSTDAHCRTLLFQKPPRQVRAGKPTGIWGGPTKEETMNFYNGTTKSAPSIIANGGRPLPLLRGVVAIFTTLFALALAVPANAACGRIGTTGINSVIKLPALAQPELKSNVMLPFNASNAPIVGLWHVIYTNSADNSTFNNTFDTWHSDGTEFESAFLPPVGGNICVGVWAQTGARSVKLHHVGWLYGLPGAPDPYDPAGYYFVLLETATVSNDGQSYTGNFNFKVYSVKDNSYTGIEVNGTMHASRINVN